MPYRLLLALLAALLLAGCGPARTAAPPAAATETAAPTAAATQAATATPAPTAVPAAAASVEFWTTEVQPVRVAAYEAIAQRFMDAHPDIEVKIVPVEEAQVSTRLAEAAAQDALPDLARLGMERVAALNAAGLLDEAAAAAVVRGVGQEDFRSGPLHMVTNPATGQPAAVPYDGWLQALWYRKDIFDTLGLAAPITWEQVDAACDALMNSAEVSYALALPTAPGDNYVHQIFEQVAMSNNALPFDATGMPAFNTPAMIESLRFYTGLQRCAPPDVPDAPSAAAHYLQGNTAMVFYSTYIMDDLVEGTERADGSRVDPSVDDLAQRTSFASSLVGPNGTAAYGQLVTLALLRGADTAAQDVARFFLSEGYLDVLDLAPLGKVPVLQSVAEQWGELSPLFANYSAATLGHIVNGYDTMQRWVLRPEYSDPQQAIIGEVEARLLIPQAIDQIMRGESTPESAAAWLQSEVEALMAQP